ncbi:hypothetical protein SAMN05421810_102467 [Amycolatopsis arida]|uniref:DUF5753 domain-containing protein n=2 Tax=Amycolatopsis arida TaxID=587909 RepID=A0A1I5Q1H4_9PSEU|nr:hypothetical protein CLV69_101467 [Amycolatopsis arida]SFP39726.1 hypothetical protein SAMN05421810_102467 [Amycolatopsis arida]
MTEQDLADRIGCSVSKVSRVETGLRGIGEVMAAVYLTHCNASREDMERILSLVRETDGEYRLQAHGQLLPEQLRSLMVHEGTARSITSYEPIVLPGLLQIEDYIRELFRWGKQVPEKEIENFIEVRCARQTLLNRRRPLKFTFYIHEHALRSVVGSAELMYRQVVHVLSVANRAHCDIRVIPASAGPFGAFGGAFRIMRYAQYEPVVYIHTPSASVFLDEPEHVAANQKIVGRLAEVALSAEESREWLAELASEYYRAEVGGDDPPGDEGPHVA